MIKAGIVGATGYAGAELVRLLTSHPEAEISAISSVSFEGQIAQIFADGFRLCRRLHDNQFRHFFFSPLSATCAQRDARSFAHIIVPQLLCALPAEIFHNFTAAHTAVPAACTPGR